MKKLKCKKIFGEWYYISEKPIGYGTCDIDGAIYHLYDSNKEFVLTFAYYDDMKIYVETGEII